MLHNVRKGGESMPLFIEKPSEKGKRSYPPAIIQGELTGKNIGVMNPREFRSKWPIVQAKFFQEVSVNAGPTRILGPLGDQKAIAEMDDLIKRFQV